MDLAADAEGNIYVADRENHILQVPSTVRHISDLYWEYTLKFPFFRTHYIRQVHKHIYRFSCFLITTPICFSSVVHLSYITKVHYIIVVIIEFRTLHVH